MRKKELENALSAIKKEESKFYRKKASVQYQKDMNDGLLLAKKDKRIMTRREFAPTNSPFAYNALYNSKGITEGFTPLLTGCSQISMNTPLTPRLVRLKYNTSLKEVKANGQNLPTFNTDRKYYTLITSYKDIINTLHTLKVQAMKQQQKEKWQLLSAGFPTIDIKFACIQQKFKNGHLIKERYIVNYDNIDFTKFEYDQQYQIATKEDFARLPLPTQQLIIALNKLEQLYAIDVVPLYLENTEIEYLGEKLKIYMYPKKSFYQPFFPKQIYTSTAETIKDYNELLRTSINFLRELLANPSCAKPNTPDCVMKMVLNGWGALVEVINEHIQPLNMLASVENVQKFLYPHCSAGVVQRHLQKKIYNLIPTMPLNGMFTLIKNFKGRPMYVFDFYGLTHLLQLKEWIFLREKVRQQLKTSLTEYKKKEEITQKQFREANKKMNDLAKRVTCLAQYFATVLISDELPSIVQDIDK